MSSDLAAQPLISVIMPTRNRAALLERSIASVLAQTWRNLELIVVDDGCTDATPAVLAAIRDSRLRVIRRDADHGAAAARNAGIRAARGDLLAFQDDDDYWLVQKLEKQWHALRDAPAGTGWCLAGYIRLEQRRCTYFGGEFYFRQIDYRQGIGEGAPDFSMIATPAWLVRREALEAAGLFDERLRSWDDWELGLRLDRVTQRVHVDTPLFVQDHVQGSAMMRAERARSDDMRIIMQKHGAMWAGNRRVLARHWYTVGRGISLHDDAPAGRAELFRSLRLRPFRVHTWAAIALSYFGPDFMRRLTFAVRRLRLGAQ